MDFFKRVYENLQPSQQGIDVLQIIVGFLGILVSHSIDVMQHGPQGYFHQLWAASPTTFIGYVFGAVMVLIDANDYLSFPVFANLVVFLMWYGYHSVAAAIGISIYSAYLSRCLESKGTLMVMFLGYLTSPLLSSHFSPALYEHEYMGKLVGVTILKVILMIFVAMKYGVVRGVNIVEKCYHIFRFFGPIEPFLDRSFVRFCQKMGWESPLQQFKRRTGFIRTFPIFDRDTNVDEGMKRIGDVLKDFLGVGTMISDVRVRFRDIKLTPLGNGVSEEGSPEFRCISEIQKRLRKGEVVTEREMVELFGEEGLLICKDKKWIESDGQVILRIKETPPQRDITRNVLKNFSIYKFTIEEIIKMKKRQLVDTEIKLSGFFIEENGTRIKFAYTIPKDQPGPLHPQD